MTLLRTRTALLVLSLSIAGLVHAQAQPQPSPRPTPQQPSQRPAQPQPSQRPTQAPSAAQAGTGAGLPAGVKRGATVEGITEYDLANGLRVLLFRDPSKATITVNVTYLVGSVDESYGETGMAHLLEHMMFKGTTTKHTEVTKELQDHGARVQRLDLVGPHELFRDRSTQATRTSSGRSTSKATAW